MEDKLLKVESGEAFEKAGLIHVIKEPQKIGPHPTVVLLQGRMGNEEVMWVFANTLPEDWLVVSVRALHSEGDGYSWFTDRSGWPSMATYDGATTAVSHFIEQLPDLYDADPSQIFLMGFSQGAALSLAIAMRHPELIQGIASLVGFAPERCSIEDEDNLRELPIFFAVGAKDTTVPVYRANASVTYLKQAGAVVTHDNYNTGHRLNSQGMKDLAAWWAERADEI